MQPQDRLQAAPPRSPDAFFDTPSRCILPCIPQKNCSRKTDTIFFLVGQHRLDVNHDRHARWQAYVEAGSHHGVDAEDRPQLPWNDGQSVKLPLLRNAIVAQYGLSPRSHESHTRTSERRPVTRTLAIGPVMWHVSKDVLAAKGVEHDERGRAFFVDKFTGLRVFVCEQQAQEEKKTASFIHERSDSMLVQRCRERGEDVQAQGQLVGQQLHHRLSQAQHSLKNKRAFLDQRVRDLATLKSSAVGYAAALAAQDRRVFEARAEWEMLRLNHDIWTTADRLKKCSRELAAVDSSWRHRTACASPKPIRHLQVKTPCKSGMSSVASTMAPLPMLVQKPAATPSNLLNSNKEIRAFAGQEADLCASILVIADDSRVAPQDAREPLQAISGFKGLEDGSGWAVERDIESIPTNQGPASFRGHPKPVAVNDVHLVLGSVQLDEPRSPPMASPSPRPERDNSHASAEVQPCAPAGPGFGCSSPASCSSRLPMFKGFALLEERLSETQARRLRLAIPG